MKQAFEQYQDIHELLAALRHPAHPKYKYMRAESRKINSQIKFGHSGIRDEQIIGGGPPISRINGELNFTLSDIRAGQRPRFGNYYAIDPATAMELRERNDAPIVSQLDRGLLTRKIGLPRPIEQLASASRSIYALTGRSLNIE
jgi:hypothetical protein